ncbi:MAG: hypothetical protein ACP5J5_06350 [Dissulfurimicrobium sp.]|uniref:hypothetical protein n=1 Tax=Dissulfurimicrobium TaxID=1769732 RepID=UPI001EDA20E5|nr:hypothetical protein [Dissulfurimicrobium hydrothermale]UKL12855.1 hypothetical protein LGS26_04990 [Dissulfurimicrobium hydrothermale]
MRQHIPTPSFMTVVLEMAAVIFFAASVWFMTDAIAKKTGLEKAIQVIANEEASINTMKGRLQLFKALKAKYMPAASAGNDTPIIWERADIIWDDITFEELMRRLYGLYLHDRPFVLESFFAGHEDKINYDESGVQGRQPTSDGPSQETGGKMTFRIKGYFLCLCR